MSRSELPPELGEQFLVRDARQQGVSRRRLAASDLSSLFHGSRSRQPATARGDVHEDRAAELLHRCHAFVPVSPEHFRFSHVTAARLFGIPLPWALETRGDLDVTVAGSSVPRRRGVIGHRSATLPPVLMRDGLPVMPVEQVWIQLAAVLDLDDLIVAGDYLVRRKRPLSTLDRLAASLTAAGAIAGAATARQALQEIRVGTDSPMESRLRLVIVRAGFREPVIGHAVYFEGHFVGTPDLAFVKERIALDFDGKVHRASERVYLDDVERRNLFADAGWRYITVTKDNLRVPRGLLARLERLLDGR